MPEPAPTLTVASVSWKSSALLARLITNLKQLADQPTALRFLIADNTNGADPEVARLAEDGCAVIPVDTAGLTMSMAHAAGLNALMPRLETPHTLIIDPDVAVFLRGWDTVLVERLAAEGVAALGAPYPGWKLGKYHDFPSPPFALWDTARLLSLAPDWRPYGRTTAARLADFARRQAFWLPRLVDRQVLRLPGREFRSARWVERIVGVVSKDTGWEVAARARKQELRALAFGVARGGEWPDAPPDLAAVYNALAATYELYTLDGQPVLSHRNPTRTRLSVNLWTSTNVALHQDAPARERMTAEWLALVEQALTLTFSQRERETHS